MRLRRGLLLALIHVALAVPLLLWNAFAALPTSTTHWQSEEGVVHAAVLQEFPHSESVSFDPCDRTSYVTVHLPPDERLVAAANFPASILAGWGEACPARWTLSRILAAARPWTGGPESSLIAGYSALIAVQWVLVGAFPLTHPRRWWREPGAFITLCSCLGAAPLLFSDALDAYRWHTSGALKSSGGGNWLSLPAELAAFLIMLAWCEWGLILVTRGTRRGVAFARRELGRAPASST